MATYNLLRESSVHIVHDGSRYLIKTTPEVSFSQTFAEDAYEVKTLHDQTKMIEGSTITKANPAQFSFSVPLTAEKDESIVMDLISDLVSTVDSGITTQQLKAFDMYVQTGSATFKVASCVVTGADFAFNPREQFKVDVQGQGTQLSRVGNESYTIPGSLQSESSTRTPLLIYPVVSVSGLDMNSILGVTVSIQNDIKWNPFETLHQSLNSTTMFPSAYTVTGRVVSGAIQQYQTDNNITQFDDFDTNTVILVTANKSSDKTPYWTLRINPAMFTARMNVASIYTQTYDFRSLDNTALGTRITQYS